MFCRKCGKQIPEQAKVCAYCGCTVVIIQQKQKAANQQPMNQDVQPVAISPVQPQKQKPPIGKKNLGLKITAIILVIAVLVSGTICGVNIFQNRVSTGNGVVYIDEFPVLKQQTELMIYDEEKFPAEEYQITVERFLIGGAMKDVSFKTTVLTDTSRDPFYQVDFGQDGEYRITLLDITVVRTQTTQAETTEKEEGKTIIIDVIVDNDSEEAQEKVDIHSPQKPVVNSLEATEDDWVFMIKLFNEMQFYLNEFDCTESDANSIAAWSTTFLLSNIYTVCAEEYGFSEKEFCDRSEKGEDPLGKYSDKSRYEGYVKYDAKAVDWIIRNIYNTEPIENEYIDKESGEYQWYRYDGCYYSCWIATGEEWYPETEMVSKKQLSDGNYEICVTTQFLEFEDEVAATYNYKIIAGLNDVDGKRVWTFDKWEEFDPKAEPETTTEQTTKKEEPTKPTSVYLEVAEKDWKVFEKFSGAMIYESNSYDCTDENADVYAAESITYLFSEVYFVCQEEYNFPEREFFWHYESPVDPKRIYERGPDVECGHQRFEADKIDWILKNVYNVEPKRNEFKTNEDFDADGVYTEVCWCYKHNGYYYSELFVGGAESGPEADIKNKKQMSDGKYVVTVALYDVCAGDRSFVGNFEVTARLKEVDGKRVWCFEKWYKI